MKRQLTGVEKALSLKSIEAMQQEVEYNEHQISICNLNLDKGLEIDYKKKVRDYKKLRLEFKDTLKMLSSKIKITQDQVRNGVDIIKPIKKEDK